MGHGLYHLIHNIARYALFPLPSWVFVPKIKMDQRKPLFFFIELYLRIYIYTHSPCPINSRHWPNFDPKYLTNASKESNLGQFMAQSMQDNDQKYLTKHNQCKPLTPKIFDKRIYGIEPSQSMAQSTQDNDPKYLTKQVCYTILYIYIYI